MEQNARKAAWKVVPALGWVSVSNGRGPRVLIGVDPAQAEQAAYWLNRIGAK